MPCSPTNRPGRLLFSLLPSLISQENSILTSNSWDEHDSESVEEDVFLHKNAARSTVCWKKNAAVALLPVWIRPTGFAAVQHCTQQGILLQLWAWPNIYNVFKRTTDTVGLPLEAWKKDQLISLFTVCMERVIKKCVLQCGCALFQSLHIPRVKCNISN